MDQGVMLREHGKVYANLEDRFVSLYKIKVALIRMEMKDPRSNQEGFHFGSIIEAVRCIVQAKKITFPSASTNSGTFR